MRTLFAYLSTGAPDPPVVGGYPAEVAAAVAAAIALMLALLLVCLVICATYRVVQLFSESPVRITAAIMATVILIGWLNR
jgi:hypothetical protein